MNIQELENKHGNIPLEPLELNEFYEVKHTKLSIEFAISVLEYIKKSYQEDIEQEDKLTEWGFGYQQCSKDTIDGLEDKIQELKQYLDEES